MAIGLHERPASGGDVVNGRAPDKIVVFGLEWEGCHVFLFWGALFGNVGYRTEGQRHVRGLGVRVGGGHSVVKERPRR